MIVKGRQRETSVCVIGEIFPIALDRWYHLKSYGK